LHKAEMTLSEAGASLDKDPNRRDKANLAADKAE
jgi:hypothetical protein